MNEEDIKKYEKAGKIAAEVLEFGRKLIKEEVLLLDVANKIEEKIISLGGKPAFPVNISLNSIAAHYTPYFDDKTVFKNDLVKLDVGVHVDGFIGDNACTIDLTKENKEMVKASEDALNEAIKIIKKGINANEIGKIINEKISSFNFKPIRNLSGHKMEQYMLHTDITIPNYDNEDKTKINDCVIAIEPFATNGAGLINEGKLSGIFSFAAKRPIRDIIARNVLQFIIDEYQTLPFTSRWIIKKFGLKANYALRLLESNGIIRQYPWLVEVNKGLVSQAEHTVLVNDKIKVITNNID